MFRPSIVRDCSGVGGGGHRVIGAANARAGQQAPPIQGVTGTIATEESVRDVHDGARGVLSKAARPVRFGRKTEVASGDAAGVETLAGLRAGTAILVHNPAAGENLTSGRIERQAADGGEGRPTA